jgi:hypothetical protein
MREHESGRRARMGLKNGKTNPSTTRKDGLGEWGPEDRLTVRETNVEHDRPGHSA